MNIIVVIIIIFIALLHLFFLYFEMFAWLTLGRKIFRSLPAHLFVPTLKLAANQGLYNGFLVAGLIWSLIISDVEWSQNVALFFLACVLTAGIYGGISVQKSIFYVQGLPALIAIVLIWLL